MVEEVGLAVLYHVKRYHVTGCCLTLCFVRYRTRVVQSVYVVCPTKKVEMFGCETQLCSKNNHQPLVTKT